jgi:hypothetical protein
MNLPIDEMVDEDLTEKIEKIQNKITKIYYTKPAPIFI